MKATQRFFRPKGGNYGSVMQLGPRRRSSRPRPGYTMGRGSCCQNVLHRIQMKKLVRALIVSCWHHMRGGACADSFAETSMDYLYWSFMVSHPAHAPLPTESVSEAIDVLTWSYTGLFLDLLILCCRSSPSLASDRLLPSPAPSLPPFSQEECQELIALLRSVEREPPSSISCFLTHIPLGQMCLLRPHRLFVHVSYLKSFFASVSRVRGLS
jgi:hypothetical protein